MHASLMHAVLLQTVFLGVFKENFELHRKSSDAALKNSILVADEIELPIFSEKGR